jgi:hypothetical protein
MRPDPGTDFVFRSEDDAASRYWYLPQSARPVTAGATQWLAFRMRLHAMQRHSPASHFAVVLRARLGFDVANRPVSISGRGITLGDTSLAQPPADNPHAHAPGFGGARGAQIESFWPGGNFLYRDAAVLPQGLQDGCWYRLQLHVNDERWIALQLQREDAADDVGSTENACIQDRALHPVQDDATGALIALGRGPGETGAWQAEFRDIACGWF